MSGSFAEAGAGPLREVLRVLDEAGKRTEIREIVERALARGSVGESRAWWLYERHNAEPGDCDCEFPGWCLFEAGFVAAGGRGSSTPANDDLKAAREALAMIEAMGGDALESPQELALRARSALRLPPPSGSSTPEQPATEAGYSLCGECGVVTADAEWEGFNGDDDGHKAPAGPQDEPRWLRCPFCCFDHTNDDSDPGVWGGSQQEMVAERARLIRDGEAGDWGDYDAEPDEIEQVSTQEQPDELKAAREALAMIEAMGRDAHESPQELALRARSALRLSPPWGSSTPEQPAEGPCRVCGVATAREVCGDFLCDGHHEAFVRFTRDEPVPTPEQPAPEDERMAMQRIIGTVGKRDQDVWKAARIYERLLWNPGWSPDPEPVSTPEQSAAPLSDDERESLIASLRPPRRALTRREKSAFDATRLAVFEQRDALEAENLELPLYDEQRIFFRAGLATRVPVANATERS